MPIDAAEQEKLIAAGCRCIGPEKGAEGKDAHGNWEHPRYNVVRVKLVSDRTLRLPIDDWAGTTVSGVKRMIAEREGFEPARQRLFFSGRELLNEWSLTQTRSEYGSTWHLMLRADPNLVYVDGHVEQRASDGAPGGEVVRSAASV